MKALRRAIRSRRRLMAECECGQLRTHRISGERRDHSYGNASWRCRDYWRARAEVAEAKIAEVITLCKVQEEHPRKPASAIMATMAVLRILDPKYVATYENERD